MDKNTFNNLTGNLNLDLNQVVQNMSQTLSKEQTSWLAGYFAGAHDVYRQLSQAFAQAGGASPALPNASAGPAITLLFASHSGNGKNYSKRVQSELESRGIRVKTIDAAAYKTRELKNEKQLLVIISTHGEGVPPPSAIELFEFLQSTRAPKLDGLKYSVLALGDKSYVHFCKAGIDLDNRLAELGAQRISERVDCDVNFKEQAEIWLKKVADELQKHVPVQTVSTPAPAAESGGKFYDAKDPFYAIMLSKINLNGRGSLKETFHVELSIEGSGISYLPGDACGIIPQNSAAFVSDLLSRLDISESEPVASQDGKRASEVLKEREITVLTLDVLKKHNAFAASSKLDEIIRDTQNVKEYLYGRDFIDLLTEYPVKYKIEELLTVLRHIPARLYSIASSPSTYQDEIHLLVGAVRYHAHGRKKEGVASTFWADRINEWAKVPVFVKQNDGFRLPADGNTPIIMIGPGKGVAPFRAFVEERAALGHSGKSWLFFGNPHFTTDFLYQTEWQAHLADGKLSRMDVAFSRDQKDKVYVQHKLLQQARDLYCWINEGAMIYVCGDMRRMAHDVHAAFIEILEKQGGMTHDKAIETVKELKKTGRYKEDVY